MVRKEGPEPSNGGKPRPFQVGFEDHQQNHLFFPNGSGALDHFSSTRNLWELCAFWVVDFQCPKDLGPSNGRV